MASFPNGLFFQLELHEDRFDDSLLDWVNVVTRVATINIPPGLFLDPAPMVNAIRQSWAVADTFMQGTLVAYDNNTGSISFTHIVPSFTFPPGDQLRYWFKPINDPSFIPAWTLYGLQNIFDQPANFGPPNDTSPLVTTANFNTIVTGAPVNYFGNSSSSSSSQSFPFSMSNNVLVPFQTDTSGEPWIQIGIPVIVGILVLFAVIMIPLGVLGLLGPNKPEIPPNETTPSGTITETPKSLN